MMSVNQDTGKIYCSAVTIQIGGNRNRDPNTGALEFRIDLNNRVASAESGGRQKVQPGEVEFAPEFGVKPRRQFVDENQPAKFKISCEGLPRPDVSWTRFGKILKNDSKIKAYEEDGYNILEIQDVTVQDKGMYTCTLTNKLGTLEASAELSVFEKPKSSSKKPVGPSVVAPLTDSTTVEGEKRFVLDCSFEDATDCSITWFKDGEEIKPGREFRARFDGRVASLTISRVIEEDVGKYECVASGPTGEEAKTNCYLKVEVSNEKREPPVFVRELRDMEVDNGDKVELVVEVKGSEPIDVFWIHNNREVTPQDTECQLIRDGNIHKLVIPQVCQQDVGEYVCEAYSDYGDTDTFCRLNVRDVELPAPPEFVSSPRLLTTEEGSSTMYTCRVRGHPVPHVSWEKDGVAIKENSHFKISMQGDEHILEILNTNKTDAGNFTCRLHNSNGEVSNTAALVVKEKTDFRSVLKTRTTLGKLGKQNSTDSEKSDKENDLQFRHVLRKSDRSTPPGGYDDKRSRSGVQQVDFRNVLKHKTSKPDPVLASKSKMSEPARETVTLKSREAYKQNRDLNKSTTVKTETISVRSVSKSKLYDSPKIEIDKFEKSSNVSLKKSPPQEDKALKSKLNKFEQMSNHEDSPSGPFVKSQTKQGSLQGRLEKFEKNKLQDEVKTKVQTTPPTSKTPDKSVLGKLNKFEKLSSGEQTSAKKKTPPPTQTPKPRGNVLDKYSFKERTSPSHNLQNGKSNVKQEDLPTKNNTTEKSVKSRKEKFEASSDFASPEKTKQSKLDKSNKLENSPEQTWRSKQESEPLAVLTTRHSDIVQQPPRVRRQLADQRVRYGHQVVLECEISGGSVDWSVNGKAIRCSKFFKMAMTPENVATLMIAEAYSEDEGEYICTATNKFGTASTSCKLFVDASSSLSSRSDIEGAVTIPARLLTITPSSLAVTRGQKVIIEATFNGEPKPEVRWFKGRDEILKDKRIQLDSTGDHSVLTIYKVTPKDAGRYMVAIENHAAKDSLCASVSIEDIPEPPGKPQANDILRTSVVLWWCGSPYDGGSQITHYKVQLKKVGDSNWTTLTSSCKNTFYQVDKLEEKTAYYFRVYAANKHGYSSSGEMSDKVFTSNRKISLDYESDGAPEVFSPVETKFKDELPFEPREVKVEPSRKFEDEYEVMHEVGKGKFGNVYKCKAKESGKIWAAKILKCREKEKANIRHEIEIMNDLAHPKLMMIWDAFEAQRSMTLVMEFVGGGELFERVISDDFELTEGDCVHFMRQTCDGVGYMHNNGILHLDLKPENILCISDKTNQIKIIDFGLARRYEDGKSIKVLFGTPEFIAPEVINYDEISFATDMWSLGVICYLLLSGLSPFLGDNDAETLANVTRGEFDFDDESFDDITDNAKDFITRLMIKTKDKRYLIKQAEKHVWLAQDERRIRSKRLNTERLKRFMLRRKWQKTGTAIRAIGRMASLQRLMSGSTISSTSSGRERCDSNASNSSNSACWDTDNSASDNTHFSSPPKVCDDMDDIDAMIEKPNQPTTQDTHSSPREITQEVSGGERETTISTDTPDLMQKKKTCPDHNGNVAISKQNGFNDSDNTTDCGASPSFIKEMLDCEAFTGDVIRFDVRVAGSPDPDFHWLHEEDEVQEDRRHIVDVSDNGQCSLIIRNVTEADEGEYSCIAVNDNGEASCSAELIVCSIGAI